MTEPRRRLLAPAVALAAAERGIPSGMLAILPGSGPAGRLRPEDLPPAAAIAVGASVAGAQAGVTDRASAPSLVVHLDASVTVPLTALQLQRMARVRAVAAAAAARTATAELDLTAAVRDAEREAVAGAGGYEHGDVRVALLPLLVRHVIGALASHPGLAVTVVSAPGGEDPDVSGTDRIDLRIVTSGRSGSVHRVLRDAGARTADEVARELDVLRRLAALPVTPTQDETSGGFTLFDRAHERVLFETLPLLPGSVGSLALALVEARPVALAEDGPLDRIRIRRTAYASLTYDQRLVDASTASAFLDALSTAFAPSGAPARTAAGRTEGHAEVRAG